MRASAWVSGSTLATTVSPTGRALIGNSDPAKNQGTMATGRQRADVLLLGGDAVGQHLGDAVHGDGEAQRRGDEPTEPGAGDVELGAAQGGRADDHEDLQRAERDGDDEVADHDQRPGDRGGEQVASGAAESVDDDAEARTVMQLSGTSSPMVDTAT